jgi:hypothetical protein
MFFLHQRNRPFPGPPKLPFFLLESHIAVSQSWCRAPAGVYEQMLSTVGRLQMSMWDTFSEERAGLAIFVIVVCLLPLHKIFADLYVQYVCIYIYEYIHTICTRLLTVKPGNNIPCPIIA